MLLAGDVGGTKTLLGLFDRADRRPAAIDIRTYRTLDETTLASTVRRFLADAGVRPGSVEAAAFGVAGPVEGRRAALTNVPFTVDLDAVSDTIGSPRAWLLNDLEALGWSLDVLGGDEVELLHEGMPDPRGNVALIAAGTGLGIAVLPNVGGRLVPRASEGGHVDFAARNSEEQALAAALTREFGRADVERVVSGPGLANIHRALFPHQCAGLTPMPDADDLPAAISASALEGSCPSCERTLEVFVSAYGAAAGNLALTVLATGGVFLGGGIAPRILPFLRRPPFLGAMFDKAPMTALVTRMPVKVILNPQAGLLGAATYANVNLR